MIDLGTVNVDIFACIHFRGLVKIGNFARIKIRALSKIGSLGFYKSNFERYVFSRIFKKHELRENMYIAKITTLTVI